MFTLPEVINDVLFSPDVLMIWLILFDSVNTYWEMIFYQANHQAVKIFRWMSDGSFSVNVHIWLEELAIKAIN